jgi:hypothetical protein
MKNVMKISSKTVQLEKLAKSRRFVILSKDIVRKNDIDKSNNKIPLEPTGLIEFT